MTSIEAQAFARRAVAAGARLAQRIQRAHAHAPLVKTDLSPVTLADFAVQALVAAMLAERFPEIPLVAEEDSAVLRQPEHSEILQAIIMHLAADRPSVSPQAVCDWIDRGAGQPADRFWTLDPVDGTKGFLRGGQYVVALSLIEEGKVVLGALGCPNLDSRAGPDREGKGCVAWALRGNGAWIESMEGGDRRRLQTSSQADPKAARMLRSVEDSHTDPDKMHALRKSLGIDPAAVLMDSQAKYVLLAAGEGDLLFRLLSPERPGYREKIWDQAAGALLVEEAGGRVTDLRGAALDFSAGRELSRNFGVLASNHHLHLAALRAIRKVGADQAHRTAR